MDVYNISKAVKDDPNPRPLVRELVKRNTVFAANRGARDKAIDLLTGRDEEFESDKKFYKETWT